MLPVLHFPFPDRYLSFEGDVSFKQLVCTPKCLLHELIRTLNVFIYKVYTSFMSIRRYSALSFLSPTHARRVWPCFDEPALKANFTVSIIHRPDYTALSNMPSIGDSEIIDGGWRLTRFETTPKMSTYLVAFVVCDYQHRSIMLRDDLKVCEYHGS